jgi:hypothetical protein
VCEQNTPVSTADISSQRRSSLKIGLVLIVLLAFCAVGLVAYKSSNGKGSGSIDDAGLAFKQGNYAKAIPIFENLASKGDLLAMCYLGTCYREGKGVPVNNNEAIKFFSKAAELGSSDGKMNLASTYDNLSNFPLAVKWYISVAEEGDAVAQYCLGLHYERGLGVKRNLKKAEMWYIKAANQGDPDATRRLNIMYSMNRGY